MARPYAFINEPIQNFATLEASLQLDRQSAAKFKAVNPHLINQVIKPGQLVIVPDTSTSQCTAEEARLMNVGLNISRALMNTSVQEGDFVVKNYDLLHSMLTYGSLGVGSVSGEWTKHLRAVERTLLDVEALHREHLAKGKASSRNAFIAKRQALFAKLDTQLKGISRWGTGLKRTGPLKKSLGISTKSYLENGFLKGYAEKIGRVATATNFIKKGGHVGIALSVGDTALSIHAACSAERDAECRKVAMIGGFKLTGALIGASSVAPITSIGATAACAFVFGIPTLGAGALACGIVGAAFGGYIGGEYFGKAGETTGTILYEHL